MRFFKGGSKESIGKHWFLRVLMLNLDIGVSAIPSEAIQFGFCVSSDKSDGTWLSASLALPFVTLFLVFDSIRIENDAEVKELLLEKSPLRGLAAMDLGYVVILEREEIGETYRFALDRSILLERGYLYKVDRTKEYIDTHKLSLFKVLDGSAHKRIAGDEELRGTVIPMSYRDITQIDR